MEAPFTLKGCSNGFSVRLIPCVSDTTFKAVQLRANKNNVRPQGKKGEDGELISYFCALLRVLIVPFVQRMVSLASFILF